MSSHSEALPQQSASALDPPSTIGFVGLGRMGNPMAHRLVEAGYTVRAYDIDETARTRYESRSGTTPVDELAEVATTSEAVITMLPDSAIVHRVLVEGGLLENLEPHTILVEMSSSEPVATRDLADLARARDIHVVDAPVSGGVTGAEAGSLTVMAGGADDHVARARPVLLSLGSAVRHVGPVGSGHALKSLNNLLSATSMLATAEAVRIGTSFGLDPEVMVDAINTSTGRSWSTQHKFPRYVLPATWGSGFGLDLMLKDMDIALRLAQSTGSPHRLSAAVVELWRSAADDLPGEADHTEIARWVDQLDA